MCGNIFFVLPWGKSGIKKKERFVMSDLIKENILIVHTRLLESYPKARCQGKVVRHSTKT